MTTNHHTPVSLFPYPGFQHVCPIESFPDEKWDAMLAVMLSAPFHLIKRILPDMKEKGKFKRIWKMKYMKDMKEKGKFKRIWKMKYMKDMKEKVKFEF